MLPCQPTMMRGLKQRPIRVAANILSPLAPASRGGPSTSRGRAQGALRSLQELKTKYIFRAPAGGSCCAAVGRLFVFRFVSLAATAPASGARGCSRPARMRHAAARRRVSWHVEGGGNVRPGGHPRLRQHLLGRLRLR